MGALKGVRKYKPYGGRARRILKATGTIGAMELWSGAGAEFQSRFVIDFDDFANKTGDSQSFWTLFLWPNYM